MSLTAKSFSNLNIVFLVFITGCMAIGFVGGSVGANKWAVASIVPLLRGMGRNHVRRMRLCRRGSSSTSCSPRLRRRPRLRPPSESWDSHERKTRSPLFYAFNFGLDQYIFPYEAVYFLYIFITERVLLRHIVTALAIRMLIVGSLSLWLPSPIGTVSA